MVLTFADVVLHFQSSPDASLLIWGAWITELDPITFDFTRPTLGTLKHAEGTVRPEYIKALPRPRAAAPAAPGQQEMEVNMDEARGLYAIYLDDTPEEEQKKNGTAPWVAFSCCCASEDDARAAAEYARKKAAKADGFRQYISAADVRVEVDPNSCCNTNWHMGDLGIYRAILPLSAKVAIHTSCNDLLKESQAPFLFDGVNFRALDRPLTGRFGQAMIMILSVLPIRTLVWHQMNQSYLSTRRFHVRKDHGEDTGNTTYSYSEVLSAILYHRLSQEFAMKHENSPISAEILQAMGELSLHSPQNAKNEAALANSVALVTALKRLQKERFWSAFPWCCTQTSRNRSALGSTLDSFLVQADAETKSRIFSAANVILSDKTRPLPTLQMLTPDCVWPMYQRVPALGASSVPPLMSREDQQNYSAAQLASWAAVSQKQAVWASRAAAALAAAQQQERDQRAYDAAYALAMAAWQAQMAMQASMPQGRPDQYFRDAVAQPHREEFTVAPGEIAHPGQCEEGAHS